jgi:hypothetical protein
LLDENTRSIGAGEVVVLYSPSLLTHRPSVITTHYIDRTISLIAPAKRGAPYLQLLRSVLTSFREEQILRERAILPCLILASFNVLLALLALPLSAPLFSLSHSQIGLLGFAGVAGASGTSRTGRPGRPRANAAASGAVPFPHTQSEKRSLVTV